LDLLAFKDSARQFLWQGGAVLAFRGKSSFECTVPWSF
jgi:hypothetical protein